MVYIVIEVSTNKDDSTGEMKISELEGSCAQENNSCVGNPVEANSNDELLDQIPVPPLAPEERIVSAVPCNGGVSYTTVAPSELGAVPEEDEEAATSSTPSTVVSCYSQIFLDFSYMKFQGSYVRLSFLFTGQSCTGDSSHRR